MGPSIYMDYYANKNLTTTDLLLQGGYDIYFTSSASISFDYRNFYTKLIYPTDVTFSGIPIFLNDNYRYQDVVFSFKTNQRKTLNAGAGVSYGSYFTGNKLSYNADIAFRKQPYGIFALSYTHNEIDMPYLSKKVVLDLIGPRIDLSFTRSLFFTAFFQYNSQINNFNINARFQWRFKPMSDIFIVYTDNYVSDNFNQKNKGLVVKFVYWLGL